MVERPLFLLLLQPPVAFCFFLFHSHGPLFLLFIAVETRRVQKTALTKD